MLFSSFHFVSPQALTSTTTNCAATMFHEVDPTTPSYDVALMMRIATDPSSCVASTFYGLKDFSYFWFSLALGGSQSVGYATLFGGSTQTLYMRVSTCVCNHGVCNNGVCLCNDGFNGTTCDTPCSCGTHGFCDWVTGKCVCQFGYSGDACGTVECNGAGAWDSEATKKCLCKPDTTGDACLAACTF
eukprot:TRINITY_DN3278_c0_g1_i3.p3 TRINITY_DN3278_c0_g1~~TRINITY_DN3278_c0_g1_i3.p3  ORF type:complete len:187 (+),score=33.79 TRINITY_DN3278_c0_g1_i3:1326-1886(+)